MARPKTNFVVIDPGSGKARPGAFVTYYLANTLTKATLYADDDVSTLANPVQANGLGQVAVRIDAGLYDISMTWNGAQPTVVEDVLAWVPEGAVLQQPGDIIVGDPSGDATRLPLGTPGQVLVSWDGTAQWKTLASGIGLPTGPAGTLLTYAANGTVSAIPPGLQDQALAIMGGTPEWVSTLLPPGTTLPINQPGDLVIGQVGTGAVARLAAGPVGSVLQVTATGTVGWTNVRSVTEGVGQCVLRFHSQTELWLEPWRGDQIWVNGASRSIPDAGGLTLSVTGLSVDTTYYIYAAWVTSALVLEASTTPYTTDPSGAFYKVGDSTRTLVGMARVIDAGGVVPNWIDTPQHRLLLSAFNQQNREATGFFTAPRLTSSLTQVEVHPEIRCDFLTWYYNPVEVSVTGIAYANTPTEYSSVLALDGIQLAGLHIVTVITGERTNIGLSMTQTILEGYHWVTLLGQLYVPSAVAWIGDAGGINTTRVHVLILT